MFSSPDNSRIAGVKVFSATMMAQRAQLGEQVTAWIESHNYDILDIVVAQSSDAAYHCISISVFYA